MRSALVASRLAAITFTKAASLYIEAHEQSWKNEKHRQQWNNTLETYAKPRIGSLLARDVGVAQVLEVLEPIWKTKTETASRLRGRIESVLDWAIARGYRDGPNPARWKGHLDTMLPAPSRVAKTVHHRALPYREIGAFVAKLRQQEGAGAKALEFLILTAARSGEVRGATWAEFDLDSALWVVPAERMKAKKEHRVPLSPRAVELLQAQLDINHSDSVFPAPKGGMLSDMTLTAVLRRMKVDAVPHGFRSTFRDWVAEQTDYPNEVAEMALAHAVGNKVEAAYRRGDLLEKRQQLMKDWAVFAEGRAG
jgi:integrase